MLFIRVLKVKTSFSFTDWFACSFVSSIHKFVHYPVKPAHCLKLDVLGSPLINAFPWLIVYFILLTFLFDDVLIM